MNALNNGGGKPFIFCRHIYEQKLAKYVSLMAEYFSEKGMKGTFWECAQGFKLNLQNLQVFKQSGIFFENIF